MKKIKTLFVLIIAASSAFCLTISIADAEEQAVPVLGPKRTTEPQSEAATQNDTGEQPDAKAKTAQPEVDEMFLVKKISFKGVLTTSEDMLHTLIQTQVGQEISEELLTQDIENLYKDTGFFSDLSVDVEPFEGGGLEVIYKVVESPKIGGISFIGNEELGNRNLKDKLTIRPFEIYSDRQRWQSERALRQLYHEKGYYLVSIQTHIRPFYDTDTDSQEKNNVSNTAVPNLSEDSASAAVPTSGENSNLETAIEDSARDDTIQVTFEINEGPRVKIEEINFIGNERLPPQKLRKQLKTRMGKHFDQILFEEEDLSLNLRNYYQDKGFAQVKILGYEKEFTDDRTGLILDIKVDEGPEFIMGTYTLEVQSGTKAAFSENKIRDMLDPAEGEIFNRGTFDESISNLQQAYLDKGYLLSEVVPIPVFDEANGLVNITLNINQGDVIIINNVVITGLEKTKEYVVRRELNWLNIKSDELLDVKSLRKARQRLFQMGSFIRAVDFVPSDTPDENRKDLRVNIAETPRTGMLSLGGGYGSEGGIFGVAEVGQNNFRGRAYRLHLKGELGTRDHHTAEVSFGMPWILGTPTRLNARLYDNRRFRRYYGTVGAALSRIRSPYLYDRYVWGRRGASVTLGHPITQDIDLSVRFRNEHIEASNPDEQLIDRSTRSILFAVARDTRDYRTSLFDPTGGSLHTLSYEYSGGILGADNEFQKYSADTSWFYSPWWNHVIAAHARAGYMLSKSKDSYFLFYERFFLGGVDTLRGYEDWEIYPDTFNPHGGDKVFYSNLEYRIPISEQLTAALFFDIGQVWDESVKNVFTNINMKRSVGAEARLTMLGMLVRLGWGYGFDRITGEPAGKFHFTVGPGF